MNGPLKMYRTRQVVRHDFKVQLPDCMYELKNIHAAKDGTVKPSDHAPSSPKKLDIFDQVKQFLKNHHNIPEMAALEIRQEEILRQLAELKKQMDSIRSNLQKSVSTPVCAVVKKPKAATVPSLPDIIINASPTNPPYSLEIVQQLWKDYIFLSFESHIHSSLSSLNDAAAQLKQRLEDFRTKANVPKVNVKLLWKEVGANTELIISQRPILGEVNILRFLSRVSDEPLNYETYNNTHEIDSLLDVSYKIVISKTKTERAALLRTLNKSLGKCQFLAGRSQISIADIAAYSAIKQATSPNEVNVNVGKWVERCAAVLS